MLLFVLASVACSLATNAPVLIAGRFLQGLGSGSAIAISAATIRDRYTGHQAARLLALRVMVLGLSPILSAGPGRRPDLGGVLALHLLLARRGLSALLGEHPAAADPGDPRSAPTRPP